MESSTNKFAAKGRVKTINGSVIHPETVSLALILVFASVSGKPEGSLYTLFDKKWRNVRADFKGWFSSRSDFKLGSVHTTFVNSDAWVVHGLCYDVEGQVDEKALDNCLKKVCDMAKYEKGSVHVSSLVLEALPVLESKLQTALIEQGVNVMVYTEGQKE